MDGRRVESWDEARWESEFQSLMEIAGTRLRPEWKHGEVVVLKTAKDHIHTLEIPDFQDPLIREPLENRLAESLVEQEDTEVVLCIATVNGRHPEIPSWNLRCRLVEINEANLQTNTALWGGGEVYYMKPFCHLLPPNKK